MTLNRLTSDILDANATMVTAHKQKKKSFACSIFFAAYNLFVSNNTYSLDLYSEELQTTTDFFARHVSSHKLTELLLLVVHFPLDYQSTRPPDIIKFVSLNKQS